MKFTLKINMDNPGFDLAELKKTLEGIAQVIEDGETFGFVWNTNGDRVGHFRVAD